MLSMNDQHLCAWLSIISRMGGMAARVHPQSKALTINTSKHLKYGLCHITVL
jgi:hypothetical protein